MQCHSGSGRGVGLRACWPHVVIVPLAGVRNGRLGKLQIQVLVCGPRVVAALGPEQFRAEGDRLGGLGAVSGREGENTALSCPVAM